MKIGFVGCGNMATAIIKGIIKKQIIEEENIMASEKTKTTLNEFSENWALRYRWIIRKSLRTVISLFWR